MTRCALLWLASLVAGCGDDGGADAGPADASVDAGRPAPDAGRRDGGADAGGPPVHCGSGARDGNETGIDCGGSCAPCAGFSVELTGLGPLAARVVLADGDDGVVVAGSVDGDPPALFVAALDGAGAVRWSRAVPVPGAGVAVRGGATRPDGSHLLVGASGEDGLVLVVSADGEVEASATLPGSPSLHAIAAAPTGGAWVAGGSGGQALIAELDAELALVRARSLGGEGEVAAHAVAALRDGDVGVVGTAASEGEERLVAARLAPDLSLRWAVTLAETGRTLRGARLEEAVDLGLLLGGAVDDEVLLIKLDAAGATVWRRAWPVAGSVRAIVETPGGGIWLAASGRELFRLGPTGDFVRRVQSPDGVEVEAMAMTGRQGVVVVGAAGTSARVARLDDLGALNAPGCAPWPNVLSVSAEVAGDREATVPTLSPFAPTVAPASLAGAAALEARDACE